MYSNINYYQKDRVAVALKKRPSIYFFNLGYILLAWKCRLRGGRKGELVDLEALFLAASFLPFMHTLPPLQFTFHGTIFIVITGRFT